MLYYWITHQTFYHYRKWLSINRYWYGFTLGLPRFKWESMKKSNGCTWGIYVLCCNSTWWWISWPYLGTLKRSYQSCIECFKATRRWSCEVLCLQNNWKYYSIEYNCRRKICKRRMCKSAFSYLSRKSKWRIYSCLICSSISS